MQQGGPTTEWYAHLFETQEEVDEYKASCEEGSYNTAGPFTVPLCLVDTHEREGALTELLDAVVAACTEIA